MKNETGRSTDSTRTQEKQMKEFDKKDVVINDVDGDAVDALSADLADVVANQTDSVEEVQLSLSKKEKELDDSKQADAKESADVAAADSGLADMIMAESQSTATSGQGGGAASADGGLSSNGKLLAVAGVVTAAGIAVAASDGDGGGSGGKNNQEFTVSVDSPSVTEGNSGSKALNFTVTLDQAPTSTVTFNYSITAGTATADDDFEVKSGTITFQAGQVEQTVSVTVLGDTDFEANETVILTVTGAQAGAAVQGTGTITNDDADPAAIDYDLSVVNTPSVVEGNNGTVTLRYELSLDRVPTENVTINFATQTTGTATAGSDYVAQSGSVTFLAGQTTSVFVDIVVNGDTLAEGDETVNVLFSSPQLSAPVTSTGTIQDDESANTFFLTTGIDNASAEIFSSQPEYTPGGDDLVNTLQDEDVLTGTGAYNVLNATIGSISEEGTESEIAPTLINIQEVNLNINDDDVSRIDFQDADDVTNLNVVRMTDTGASITLDNLAAGTDEIGIESATSQGTINLLYREDELTALDNTLDLNVGQSGVVRLSQLNISETGDSAEDQGFGFETVNMTTDSLTNIDNIFIAPNANEDRDNGTDQAFNLDANASTEINNLVANGIEFMTISADGEVMIAADEDDVLDPLNDGISTAQLQMLTIDGSANVTIDGLDGDIDNGTTGTAGDSADDTTLVVDGSAMTGDLTLGVVTGADGESADANYEDRADKDLSVTSGSGDDTIQVYSALAGDITTNGGNDSVRISDAGLAAYDAVIALAVNPANPTPAEIAAALAAKNAAGADVAQNVEGVSTIDTGAGDDSVLAGDLGATDTDDDEDNNGGFDDVTAAQILTGDGNDSVTVGNLNNSEDWDNFNLADANADDLFNIKAASISTGAGSDTVAFDMAAENAVIDTGADADTVNVELDGQMVLAGDTDANYTMLNKTSAGAIAGQTKEVKADGTADLLGAQLLLGEGDDVANFNETDADPDTVDSPVDYGALIVGQDALLDGGAGNDVMNVTALDVVFVNTLTTADDAVTAAEEFDWDIDANITGIETANLTIANQIDSATDAAVSGADENDNVETDGAIHVDVMRFDSALTNINLVSEEARLLQNPANEIYEQGEQTYFNIFNLRQPSINLTLKANEASGIAGAVGASNGAAPVTGTLADDRIIDVILDVDLDTARADDDTFSLDILAGSESFDLDLELFATVTDVVGDAASATDDDDQLVENAIINLQDNQSHRILFNGFGDNGQSNEYIEGSLNVETSVTVNDSKDGSEIVVDQVTADTITVTGGADVEVYVGQFANQGLVTAVGQVAMTPNNYEITTGSGDDLIDMFFDDVRSDNNVDDAGDADAVDATDEADIVNAGAGDNRLRVSGDDDLGTTVLGTDDDVFENLFSLQTLEIGTEIVTGAGKSGVEFFAGGVSNEVVLDEAAQDKTNVQDIVFSGGDWTTGPGGVVAPANGAQTTLLTIGENFENDLTITSVEEGNEKEASLDLTIDNQDSDTDVDLVNMDIFVATQFGTRLDFINTGDLDAVVNITARVSDIAGDQTLVQVGGFAPGVLDLNVQMGDLDSLTLLDNKDNSDGDADDNDQIIVTIDDSWSVTQVGATANDSFIVDASAVEDDDADSTTGGMDFDGSAETDSDLLVKGTQNDDFFIGGEQDDTFEGNDGDDVAFSGLGDDTLQGGAGDDELHGQEGTDTINGGEGDDRIWGNADSDNLTGGAGADAFVYNATSDSDGSQTSTDTITDFQTAGGADTQVDVIEYTLDVTGGVAHTNGFVTVNLGRFAQVADLGAGDNSLDGTPTGAPTGGPIYGDGFWATNGGFVLDVDGNGDVTEGDDLQINSDFAIGEGDLNIDVIGSAGSDLIRGGDGINEIFGNGGDDLFVFVGKIDSAQANAYQGTAAGIIAGENIGAVLSVSELTNVKDTSEVRQGDTLFGGAGNDRAVFFGDVDLSVVNNGAVFDVEAGIQYSSVRMTVEQFLGFDTYEFGNTTDHELTIIDVDALGNVKVLTAAEINDAILGNYFNEADFDADGNLVNLPGDTIGEVVDLSGSNGVAVNINGESFVVDAGGFVPGGLTAVSENLSSDEDSAVTITGNVLDNETVAFTAVNTVNGDVAQVGVGQVGDYGVMTINSDGTYSYARAGGLLAQADVDALDAGDTDTDVFTYTLTDGSGVSTTATITVTINGQNDAAVINAGIADNAVTEGSDLNANGGATHTDADDDQNDSVFQVVTGVSTTYGSYSVAANGAWTYTLSNNAAVNALADGQMVSDTVVLTAEDNTTENVTINITGANDAPVVTQGAVFNSNGFTFTASDVDNGAALTIATGSGPTLNMVNNGTQTTVIAAAQAAVSYNDLRVSDGTTTDLLLAHLFEGTTGDDVIDGTLENTFNEKTGIYGFGGNDTITGTNGNDFIVAGAGIDTVNAGLGDDTIYGGSGIDTINGGDDNDTVYGGSGADIISGNSGADMLFGEAGGDTISGNGGADTINGGAGADTLTGNGGSDTFVYSQSSDSVQGANDTITDWESADKIDLTAFGLASPVSYQENVSADVAAASIAADTLFGSGTDIVASVVGGDTWVFVDSNSDNAYTAGSDLAILLQGVNTTVLDASNFVV
jgi:VCBS repeat-containing protein